MPDTKVTGMTEATSLADTDLLYAVANVATTPVKRKMTIATLKAIMRGAVNLAEGYLINGKIVPSVASNNLTVAIKTLANANPSAADPVYVRLGDTVRSITAALSVTKNAGTNWANRGSDELKTKETDLFAYLGYNATDGVVLGWSPIPYANIYSDFSATSTNERYAAISTITNAAAGDQYVLIGRFAATLSAGAGYTWTVPTYTPVNLIQRPIFSTRRLDWAPTLTGYSANPSSTVYQYIMDKNIIELFIREAADGTSNATGITLTLPMAAATITNMAWIGIGAGVDNGAAVTTATRLQVSSAGTTVTAFKDSSGAAWTAGSTGKRIAAGTIRYAIG